MEKATKTLQREKSQRHYSWQNHKDITEGKVTKTLQWEKPQRQYRGQSHKDITESKLQRHYSGQSRCEIAEGTVAKTLQKPNSQRHCRRKTDQDFTEGKVAKTIQKGNQRTNETQVGTFKVWIVLFVYCVSPVLQAHLQSTSTRRSVP